MADSKTDEGWNSICDNFLAHHLVKMSQELPLKKEFKRWIVGIVGVPCSGKSVSAENVCKAVNIIANKEVCQFIGMDGFHYTRKHLDSMKDPALAHQKRGAHWTFDAEAFGTLLADIANNVKHDIVAPTFDHRLKDPTPNGTVIKPQHKIVIVEGLYLFLNILPWKACVYPHFNERWYLKCDWQLAEKRIVKRHVQTGVTGNEKDAMFRWLDSDKPNGVFLLKHLDLKMMNVIAETVENGVQITNINWNISKENTSSEDILSILQDIQNLVQ